MDTIKICCPHCGQEIDESFINQWKAKLVGQHTSEKKAKSSAENGKKGGRPRKLGTGLSLDAMKDGKPYVLMLVRDNDVFVKDTIKGQPLWGLTKTKYRLVICHPGGGQTNADYQPENGEFQDIHILAEKNGFEPIDRFKI